MIRYLALLAICLPLPFLQLQLRAQEEPPVSAVPPVPPVPPVPAGPDMGPGPGMGPGFFVPGGGGDAVQPNADGGVMLQFPLNGVSDILSVYERLTQKTVLRDTSIFEGAQVSLVTAMEVPRDEAIRLIEATLTLNGYVIVDEGDGKTLKVLLGRVAGQPPGGVNGGSGVYTDEKAMPAGDLLVSYFLGLEFLPPNDAALLLSNHVQMNAYGRITPVESPAGLLITDSAGIVRKMIRLQELIDVPPGESRLMAEFVKLEFADANTVAQIIQATMDARYEERQRMNELGRTLSSAASASRGAQPEARATSPDSRSASAARTTAKTANKGTPLGSVLGTESEPSAQLVADDRLNRIFVQASPTDFAFILDLIRDFDQPLMDEEPLERVLNYVKVVDVLPVIVDVLMDKGSGTTQLPGGRSLETRQEVASSSSLASLAGVRTQQQQQQQRFQQQTSEEQGSRPDRLAFPVDDVAPVSVLVGKTRLIADRQTNAILVIGSSEAKRTVFNILEKLDRKPPQVYLAVVIGQLELGSGLDIGTEFPEMAFSGRGWSEGFDLGNVVGQPGIEQTAAVLSSKLINNAGLNVYGAIGTQLDVFINALVTTNRFKVLSRPVLSVMNNKRASITNGKKIPVPQATITDATGGTRNAALSTTITFENVVLKLEMIPQINENDEVTLEIVQVNDTAVGEEIVANNTVPVIGTQELTTTVTVPNRRTIVLGGLITEELTQKETGLPLVRRIPVMGQIFRDTEKDVSRKELLIFIQPVVVRDHADLATASFDEDLRTEVAIDAADAFPEPGQPTRDFEAGETAKAEEAAAGTEKAVKKTGLFRVFSSGTSMDSRAEEIGARRKLYKTSR